jgi:hypothetical protein
MVVAEVEEAAGDAAAAAAAGGAPAGTADGLPGASTSASSLLGSKEVGEMLAFALPALGMVLADPLMSLIDTGG